MSQQKCQASHPSSIL